MSCGASRRCGLDPVLLWLWCRPAATAPIGPLTWEPPYAEGEALKGQKDQKKKKKKKDREKSVSETCVAYKIEDNKKYMQFFDGKETYEFKILSLLLFYFASNLLNNKCSITKNKGVLKGNLEEDWRERSRNVL